MSTLSRWLRIHLVWQTTLLLAAVTLAMSVLTAINRREEAAAREVEAAVVQEMASRTREQAHATVGLLGGLALLGIVTAWWAGQRFREGLLEPLRRLEAGAAAMAAGELERRVEVPPGDGGLSSVARSLNELCDQLHDQVIRHHRNELVLHVFADHVLADIPEPAWLVDERGRVVAANRPGREALLLDPDSPRHGVAEPLHAAGGERVGALVRAAAVPEVPDPEEPVTT